MSLVFHKMHGAGNDFVLLDLRQQEFILVKSRAQQIADRRKGIGCDQILVLKEARSAENTARYEIWNADGSLAGQCGNGARCFALFVRQQGLTTNDVISVATSSGLIELVVKADQVTVNMGVPDFNPDSLPFSQDNITETYDLVVNDTVYAIGAVSMGNPHAVMVVDDLDDVDVGALGKSIESHSMFPNRVNAGFMQIINRNEIRLRVYERGVGETKACGTGACAAVAVGRMLNKLDEQVTVHLHGGDLDISWSGEGSELLMTGPATTVFQGKINCE